MISQSNDKKIAQNMVYVYGRVIITTILGLFTTRFTLEALGQSDFGLYNVVGGIVAVLNILSTAMSTTTRRFINIEMGKPSGNLNKIFNICMVIHIGLAVFMLLLLETLGVAYIQFFLNVSEDRFVTSHIIFQISSIVSVFALINVPYQSLMAAYEDFKTVAIIDILYRVMQLVLIFGLMYFSGDKLIMYAVIMCMTTFLSLICYSSICKKRWRGVVKWSFYKDNQTYKDIIVFNNYTALGASSYIARSQGSNMIVNYFFGTLVNGAFSIAYMLESYALMVVSNLSTAASPQITQSYSSGNIDRSVYLSSKINRYSILFMLLLVYTLSIDLEYILKIWLGKIPDGAIILCYLTLICAFVRSLSEGIPPLIHATGKIKWFQVIGSIADLIVLPVSYLFYVFGLPVYTIIVCYIFSTALLKIINLYLMYRLINFNVWNFVKQSYLPSFIVLIIIMTYFIIYKAFIDNKIYPFVGILSGFIVCSLAIYFTGLTSGERSFIVSIINKIIKI